MLDSPANAFIYVLAFVLIGFVMVNITSKMKWYVGLLCTIAVVFGVLSVYFLLKGV